MVCIVAKKRKHRTNCRHKMLPADFHLHPLSNCMFSCGFSACTSRQPSTARCTATRQSAPRDDWKGQGAASPRRLAPRAVVALTCERELEQGDGDSSLRGNRQRNQPSRNPSAACCSRLSANICKGGHMPMPGYRLSAVTNEPTQTTRIADPASAPQPKLLRRRIRQKLQHRQRLCGRNT